MKATVFEFKTLKFTYLFSNSPSLDDSTTFYTIPYESNPVSLNLVLSKGKGKFTP